MFITSRWPTILRLGESIVIQAPFLVEQACNSFDFASWRFDSLVEVYCFLTFKYQYIKLNHKYSLANIIKPKIDIVHVSPFNGFLTVTGPIGYTPHGTVWQSTAKKSVTPFSLVLGSNWLRQWILRDKKTFSVPSKISGSGSLPVKSNDKKNSNFFYYTKRFAI